MRAVCVHVYPPATLPHKAFDFIFLTHFTFAFLHIFILLLLFFFWPRHAACGILVPQPGIEPGPSAVKALSPNHWTARELPLLLLNVSALHGFF